MEGGAHRGHRERLRQRIAEGGIDSLQEHEILEFLLYYAELRGDTNPLAHALIRRFGSLGGVLRADPDQLRRVPGMGPCAAEWLGCVRRLLDGYRALENADRPLLNTLRRVKSFALYSLPEETGVWQLCLNRAGMLLIATRLGGVGAWGEPQALRAGVEEVIRTQARGVLLVQKCAPDAPEREAYDAERTSAYAETLRALDARLLDHVRIRDGAAFSLTYAGQIVDAEAKDRLADEQRARYLSEM